jgi:putative membrane protein
MKDSKHINMKNVIGTLSIFALILALASGTIGCNTTPKGEEIKDSISSKMNQASATLEKAADTVGAKLKVAADSVSGRVRSMTHRNGDSSFVEDAIIGNMEELKMLHRGMEKGKNAMLKSDASKMIADHNKLGTQLKAYATQMGYAIPQSTDKGNTELDQLDKHTQGTDWDKAWADEMIKDHERDITAFEHAQSKAKDDNLKNMIDGALPTLRNHLDMMKTLRDNLK